MTIDSYLDSLRGALAGRLPTPITDQRLQELETHLWMSAADHRGKGLDDRSAMNLAIAELGAVEVVADGIVRQRLGYGPGSKWSFTRLAVPALFFGIAAPYWGASFLAPFWPTSYSWQVLICDTAAWVAIVCVAIGVWRSRRWLVGPILRWTCPTVFLIAIVRLLLLPANVHFSNGQDADLRLKIAQASLKAEAQSELDAIDKWSSGHAPTDAGPVTMVMVQRTMVPLLPFPWDRPEKRLVLQSLTPSEAMRAWSLYGNQYARQLAPFRAELATPTGLREHYATSTSERLWIAIKWMTPTMAVGAGLAYGLNGFVLLLAGLSDDTKNRRLRRRLALGG